MSKMSHEQFLLMKLAEEASEVAQIALKTAQFGMTEKHPDLPLDNKHRIYVELNDLLAVVDELNTCWSGFGYKPCYDSKINKIAKLNEYLGYSIRLGKVEIVPAIFGNPTDSAKIKQLKPVPVPDNFYCWSHPDMHLVDPRWSDDDERPYTQEDFNLLKDNAGVDITHESFDPFDEIPKISNDSCDWSKWKPKPPSPDHFLIGAYDTEDGPVLWWAKQRVKDSEVG